MRLCIHDKRPQFCCGVSDDDPERDEYAGMAGGGMDSSANNPGSIPQAFGVPV